MDKKTNKFEETFHKKPVWKDIQAPVEKTLYETAWSGFRYGIETPYKQLLSNFI